MKFFSNEAKENDPEYDRSDVAASEPVAVPQQRAGSPWNDTPGEDYRDPQHRTDSSQDGEFRQDGVAREDEAEIAEQELRDGTSERPEDRPEEPEVARVSDPVTTTYGPDGTVTHSDEPVDIALDEDEDREARDRDAVNRDSVDRDSSDQNSLDRDSLDRDEADRDEADRSEDGVLKDDGTFDSPSAVEPATGEPIDADTDNRGKEPKFDADDNRIDDTPVAVDAEPVPALDDRDTSETATTDPAVTEPAATDEPVVAAAPVPGAPGTATATSVDRLFSDGDSFAERFRDVQLRFVDSPKEAVADAAALVSEAVDKITSALNSQKDSLGGDSDDTEQLRVQLRGYRDLLNRLTGL